MPLHPWKQIVPLILAFVALAAAVPSAGGSRLAAGRVSSPATVAQAGTFSATLTLRQTYATSGGSSAVPSPPWPSAQVVTFQLGRVRTNVGTRTILALQSVEPVRVQTPNEEQMLDQPFVVSRIEFDEPAGPVRAYGPNGAMIPLPNSTSRAIFGLPADGVAGSATVPWSVRTRDVLPGVRPQSSTLAPGGLVATVADAVNRRQRLAQQFGNALGQVRGLDRYLGNQGDSTYEVLVHPGWAIPVEVNRMAGSTLVARSLYSYEAASDGTLVRRFMHVERALATAGTRAITDVEVGAVTWGGSR